jgi:hypothetical protein
MRDIWGQGVFNRSIPLSKANPQEFRGKIP